MENQRIDTRLTFLVVFQSLILALVGFVSYLGIDRVNEAMGRINQTTVDQANLSRVGETVRTDLLALVNKISRGTITWEEASTALPLAKSNFEKDWENYLSTLNASEKKQLANEYGSSLNSLETAFDQLHTLLNSRDRIRLNLFVTNDLDELTNPFFKMLQASVNKNQQESERALTNAQSLSNSLVFLLAAFSLLGLAISLWLGSRTYRSIVHPVNRIIDTVRQVAEGNYDVRAKLTGSDELAQLAQAFDQLLDDKMATLVALEGTLRKVEKENDALNTSIIGLLQAVSQLSRRDLTVRVPVTEDITGPLADALNLLTDETAKVLQGVTKISEEVAMASNTVKAESDEVVAMANAERTQVERTSVELAAASNAMNDIAQLAQACNRTADSAINRTQAALETVTNTVVGINNIRDTIRETEKRMKRLGERSQEISSAVNLINSIAERTHILALNASMHAASAGEAGRGFAVIADEVQRLAENARQATSQIANLVSNIQTEAADTINTMNSAISQVVEGSRLAEQAGERMKETQHTTAELVMSVQQIAAGSKTQAEISNELHGRAQKIEEITKQTSQRLREQNIQTDRLLDYAKRLVDSVRVFKLPGQAAASREQTGDEDTLRAVGG